MPKSFARRVSSWCSLLLALAFVNTARTEVCWTCGKVPLEFFTITDEVIGDKKVVCSVCAKLKTFCYLCGLPAKDKITELLDGRVLCFRDAKEVVLDENEAKRICAEGKGELDRLFSRFTNFPDTNATIEIVDKTKMQLLIQTPGFERQCPSIFGYVRSRVVQGGRWKHPISLLSGLPKYRLMAVCAHEFAHTWVRENVPTDRDMDRDSEEGFCDLVAYRLVEFFNQEKETKVIRENPYTRGQFELFLEADTAYGFYTIMQWMKWGRDHRLSEEEPDRIRRSEEKPLRSAPAALDPAPLIMGPTPVPDSLTLVGILGGGSKRLVLINDCSLSVGESGKVRFAKTNAVVQCVEIRTNSAVIEVGDERRREELFLKGN